MTDATDLLKALAPYLELIERTAADVRALKAQAKPATLLVSFRQAAKLLRVDRATTLRALVDSGQLEVVMVNGRERIARAEVDRLAAQGFDRDAPVRRKRAPKKIPAPAAAATVEAEILGLKL